ncbi:transporter [Acuticoccus sp. I52.16.1]|uniref:SphA family protein n=1 Tax=Acuticoccus sp. I52.16.1 TaxID=2928472 RepID=UPI001FD37787|nr:transporter [Acuticoccus sp. I52.16.1]UOM34888.1 transporter [Acuticoccus sp. I52.16.1]
MLRIWLGIAAVLAAHSVAWGEEGGYGHYVPGISGTLVDRPSTEPGWAGHVDGLYFDGGSKGPVQVLGPFTPNDMEADLGAVTLGAAYTFDERIANAFFSVGLVVPFIDLEVSANVATPLGNVPVTHTDSGIGDIAIIPAMLAWQRGNMQFGVSVPVYLPTGGYEVGRLANVGKNYLTVDPTVSLSYTNPATGFSASGFMGLTLNTKNTATQYQSGSLFHLEASAQQLFPVGPGYLGIGAEAFYLQQISDDSGPGALLGGFRGRSIGIGPVLTYVLPLDNVTGAIEAKWLPEIDTENRIAGDYFWVKGVLQF